MFMSRIITSRYIAVKWYLRVYWLLPHSIVDSFTEHRRLFCWAPWILGPVNQLHFPKDSFPAFSGLFFSSSTESADNLTEIILNQQTPANKTLVSFCLTKRSCQRYRTQVFWRTMPGYVLALLKNGHQWDGVSPLTGTLQERNDSEYFTCRFLPH